MRYEEWGFNDVFNTSNEKISKSQKHGVLIAAQYLAPARLSGFNVCAASTAACRALCLNTAGNPAYAPQKARARLARTLALYANRAGYVKAVAAEIERLERKAKRESLRLAIRLNGTSDIAWHRIAPQLFEQFKHLQFYDYTKVKKRLFEKLPSNYHLTYSYAENDTPDDARAIIATRHNVAIVFAITPKTPMIKAWHGMSVIDGDTTDYRPRDKRGAIVGLRAKGAARKHDKWGFVQHVSQA
jgi:hypothetical protein